MKTFHPRNLSSASDSREEINNLKILKESITSHKYIRTHLAALFHKGEHIILLPWADRYDLHLFLLEGHDQYGTKVYDFESVFNCRDREAFVRDTYKQIANIAAALKWLHEDVKPHNRNMYFAHMDLKPDNILIDNDTRDRSTVGKWVLTDFGISAFKERGEEKEEEEDQYITVRDYVEERQNLTINTPARREAGAYQPPEIERLEHMAGGPSNVPQQRRVGRRGDIWSFGCIFAEVVAFSMGRRPAVTAFRGARQGVYGNDYFYTFRRSASTSLSPDALIFVPELRPEMERWLRGMPRDPSFSDLASKVLECSVEAVFEILQVDERPGGRPRAKRVLSLMEHLTDHFHRGFQPGQDCVRREVAVPVQPLPVVNRPNDHVDEIVPPRIIVRRPTPGNGGMARTDDDATGDAPSDEHPAVDPGEAVEGNRLDDGSEGIQHDEEPPQRVASDELYRDPNDEPDSPAEGTQDVQPRPGIQHEPSVRSPRPSTTSSQGRGQNLLGLPPSVRSVRDIVDSYGVQIPRTKIERIALCSTGNFVATITKPSTSAFAFKTQHTLRRYTIAFGGLSVAPHPSLTLPSAKSWDDVFLHQDMIVAWGNGKNGKQVSTQTDC